MALWFEGTFKGNRIFQIHQEKDNPAPYSLTINGEEAYIKEASDQKLLDLYTGTDCFRTETGLFLFPWRWGQDSKDWPRYQTLSGSIHLVKLSVERGYLVDVNKGQRGLMHTIRGILDRVKGKSPKLIGWPRKD